MLRVIREILSFQPRKAKTDLAQALDYLGRVISRRAVVFTISDFQAEGFERPMRVLARRHDMIAVTIADPGEMQLPDVGLIELEDAETGETVLVDAGSPEVRRSYERLGMDRTSGLAALFRSVGVDRIDVMSGRGYVMDLVRFFRQREKRRR